MKKLLAMLCMLTCVFGLTACGNEEALSEMQQQKVDNAKVIATDFVVPYMANFFNDANAQAYQENFDVHELKALTEDEFNYVLSMRKNYGYSYNFSGVQVEGNAILNGIVSFNGTFDSLYNSLEDVDYANLISGEASYEISGDEIIVKVPLTGTKTDSKGNVRTAEAEVIFTNDLFLTVKSCALNLDQSIGELMIKAAMDTLMGMGTVFVILIMISLLIWAFGGIPKLQEKLSGKNKQKTETTEAAVENTIARIVEKEESAESADELELAAVIAAAVAAYEGASGTDGFVVRSIRKRR